MMERHVGEVIPKYNSQYEQQQQQQNQYVLDQLKGSEDSELNDDLKIAEIANHLDNKGQVNHPATGVRGQITKEVTSQLNKNKQQDNFKQFINNGQQKQKKQKQQQQQQQQQCTFSPMINPRSADLFRKKQGEQPQQQGGVYQRLFLNAFTKEQKYQERKAQAEQQLLECLCSPKHLPPTATQELGAKHYLKAQQNMASIQQHIQQQQQQKLLEEQLFQFTPTINNNSRQMVTDRDSVQDRLYAVSKQWQDNHAKRLQDQHQQHSLNLQQTCTFAPTINQTSKAIDQLQSEDQEQSVTRQIKLNQLAKEKPLKLQLKKNKIQQQECPFSPIINKTSQKLMGGSQFFDRLEDKQILKSQKSQVNFMIEDEQIDKSTGAKLFQPQIKLTASTSKRKPQNISDLLYKESTRRQKKKQYLKESINKSILDQQHFKSNSKSEIIVEKNKKQRLIDIFNELDNDNDGHIDSEHISIDTVDLGLLELLKPLLVELEEQQVVLNEQEFTAAGLALFHQLNPQQKHLFTTLPLLHHSTNSSLSFSQTLSPKLARFYSNYTFKPQIDPHSQSIAANSRSHQKQIGLSHFQILHDQQKIWDEKKKAKLQDNQLKEVKDCTFFPVELLAKQKNQKILKSKN